ncbi:spindle and kinetochore-associated protein 2 isoform X1 [Pezoporus occidentalis]|uniref:spindle and kinetochore-associated protein 2 isoform X1 n=1 Tax=Pezoporus occidentalis TaxID=407982 RepID=UPI002F908862
METAVTRLETMFQKAESDLDYIRHRLEFEILKGLPDDLAPEENPVALLEEIAVVKSRYKTLSMQMKKVFTEQRESIRSICAALVNTMKIVRVLKQHAGLECLPLSAEEQAAALQLTSQTVELLVEEVMRPKHVYIPETIKPECSSSEVGRPSYSRSTSTASTEEEH